MPKRMTTRNEPASRIPYYNGAEMIEIKAPEFPESVRTGSIAAWHKRAGETAREGELLADVETDKVMLEVLAPEDGTLTRIARAVGEEIGSCELIGYFEAGPVAAAAAPEESSDIEPSPARIAEIKMSGAVRRLLEERDLDAKLIPASGKGGRLIRADVLNYLKEHDRQEGPEVEEPMPVDERSTRRAPMSRIRMRIAERMLEARRDTAMLTTFNEADMSEILALRAACGASFQERHGIKLGLMSFFTLASCDALMRFPLLNAAIDDREIVYHDYCDIGVAVSTERGLVVPVLRDAQHMGLAQIETTLADKAARARDGRLSLEEMQGGTFTISNGGVYGSLMSTPILNPPQVAILGLHAIVQRPVAIEGELHIRSMMYLALSYDHRLVDGSDAVRFLKRIKDVVEHPGRLALDL